MKAGADTQSIASQGKGKTPIYTVPITGQDTRPAGPATAATGGNVSHKAPSQDQKAIKLENMVPVRPPTKPPYRHEAEAHEANEIFALNRMSLSGWFWTSPMEQIPSPVEAVSPKSQTPPRLDQQSSPTSEEERVDLGRGNRLQEQIGKTSSRQKDGHGERGVVKSREAARMGGDAHRDDEDGREPRGDMATVTVAETQGNDNMNRDAADGDGARWADL